MKKAFFRSYPMRDGGQVYCVISADGNRLTTLDIMEALRFREKAESVEEVTA